MLAAQNIASGLGFTYGDYCSWPDDERWELIDGEAYAMTAPSRQHQKLLVELSRQISTYFLDKPCESYVAPFDVRLPHADEADEQIDTVVQPDIVVICDENKLDDKGCRGAPDWVIEILSPSTAVRDMNTKRQLYEKHGVKEYWLIHPVDQWVMIYVLNAQGIYDHPAQMMQLEGTASSTLFADFAIDWTFLN